MTKTAWVLLPGSDRPGPEEEPCWVFLAVWACIVSVPSDLTSTLSASVAGPFREHLQTLCFGKKSSTVAFPCGTFQRRNN